MKFCWKDFLVGLRLPVLENNVCSENIPCVVLHTIVSIIFIIAFKVHQQIIRCTVFHT